MRDTTGRIWGAAMRENEEERDFKERFEPFSFKVEKALKKTILVFLVLLVLIQLLWQIDPVRRFFVPVEKMEGTPILSQLSGNL